MSIFYKSEQVAELLGVALPRVRQLANDGKLRTKLQDGDTLVSANSLVDLAGDSDFGLLKDALPAFVRSQGLGTGSLFSLPAIAGLMGNSTEGVSDMVRNGLLSSVEEDGKQMITGNSLTGFLEDKSPENDSILGKVGDFALGQMGIGGSGIGGKLAAGAAGVAGAAGLTGVVSDVDLVGGAKDAASGISSKVEGVTRKVSGGVESTIEGGKSQVEGVTRKVSGSVESTIEGGKSQVEGVTRKVSGGVESTIEGGKSQVEGVTRKVSGGVESTVEGGERIVRDGETIIRTEGEEIAQGGERIVRESESVTYSSGSSGEEIAEGGERIVRESGRTVREGGTVVRETGREVVEETTRRRSGLGWLWWLLPLILLGLLLWWLLRGCGGGDVAVAPTAEPIAEPTAEVVPTDEPTDVPPTEAPPTDVPPTEEAAAPVMDSVASIAAGNGNFNTLLAALGAAGLAETFSDPDGGPFTVFAPTDDAFAALPEGELDALLADPDALSQVLQYHVVDGNVDGATAATLASAPTLQGEEIAIAVGDDGGLVLNGGTNVTGADVAAGNSVVHVIDSVLLPPSQVAQAPATPGTIAEVATEAGTFNTLLAALGAAGLAETFADAEAGPFTVFAPSDEAFAALPEGTVESLLADPEGALTDILTYHVVEGTVLAEDVVGLDSATTLGGQDISITLGNVGVVLNDEINVVQTDILASNGVIHVIDGVLIPASDTPPAEEEPEPAPEPTEEPAEEAPAPPPAEPGSITVTIPPLVKGEEAPSMAFDIVGADGAVVASGMTGDTVSVDAGTYTVNIKTNPVTTISDVEVGSGADVTVSP